MAEVSRPVVTMSKLGKKGRFGNQIFQYSFLKIYARVFNLRVETPNWIGQYLFGHNDPPIARKLPVVKEQEQSDLQSLFGEITPRYKNVDFFGYYQFHTKYFAPYKGYFQSLFMLTPKIKAVMEEGLGRLLTKGQTIVGLHIRRGDYKKYNATVKSRVFYVAPVKWYKSWLNLIWEQLKEPVLFIASDEIEAVFSDFAEYRPFTSKDIYGTFPKADFYPDYYLLTQCDVMAISNSTFSFTASMLNNKSERFWRPDLNAEKLISYDPWSSLPLLNRVRNFY